MDNMDIDQVAYVPDTPNRSTQPNTNAGVCISEESDLVLPGSLKNRDFSDEELRNQQSRTPELIIDNKGTRPFFRPSKNLSVSDNPECRNSVIRNSSSSNNVTSCTRTVSDRVTNHHNYLSFRSRLLGKGKAPSTSESFAFSEGAAAVDLRENQRTFQKGASGNFQVEPKKESIPANGFPVYHIANTTKRKEKVDNRDRVGSSADHLKGFHLSVGDQFKGGKTVSGSLPAASFPRVIGQKRLVRNGCISPHNIAKAKQLAEKHDNVSSSVSQNNVETVTPSVSSDLTNLRDMVADESNIDRVKGKGLINYSYSSKYPDIKILNLSSRSSDGSSGGGDVIEHSEELCGWRTTHNDRKKSNLSLSDVGQRPSRGKDVVTFGDQQHENGAVRRVRGNEISVSNDLSEDQELSSKEVVRPVKCGKLCLGQCGGHQAPDNTEQGSASHNGGECSASPNSEIVFLRSPREQSNLRSTRTQNRLRLGTLNPVVEIDDSPEIRQSSSLSVGSSINVPDVRARQLEADELLAREIQEQLYNEMPGVGISEVDAQLALALQQQYSQDTFSGRSSSTSDSRRRGLPRSSQSSSAQVRVPTNRMARLRNRFPGQPRTLSSRISNSLFTPNMDLDERIHILEALEAFSDMGMASNLLQVNRDFNGNDYEMLLALDEDNHQVGVSVDQINSLPQSIVQSDNFEEDCAICLETPTIGDTIRHLPCLHKFHKDCIDTWLTRKALCPVCKSSIT